MPGPNFMQQSKRLSLASKLYRPTRFYFEIPRLPFVVDGGAVSTGIVSSISDFEAEIFFSTETAFFPGRNIASEPYKTSGPVDEIPYESTYSGDLTITMRISQDFKERRAFEAWMDRVINQKRQTLNYPDSYRCEAFIKGYSTEEGEETYRARLTEVWPKSIGQVSVGQGLTDSVGVMQLQLAFRRYFVKGSGHDQPEDVPLDVADRPGEVDQLTRRELGDSRINMTPQQLYNSGYPQIDNFDPMKPPFGDSAFA